MQEVVLRWRMTKKNSILNKKAMNKFLTKDELPVEHFNSVMGTFAEQVYKRMAEKRFGVTMCCKKDINKVWLEKERLELLTKNNF